MRHTCRSYSFFLFLAGVLRALVQRFPRPQCVGGPGSRMHFTSLFFVTRLFRVFILKREQKYISFTFRTLKVIFYPISLFVSNSRICNFNAYPKYSRYFIPAVLTHRYVKCIKIEYRYKDKRQLFRNHLDTDRANKY